MTRAAITLALFGWACTSPSQDDGLENSETTWGLSSVLQAEEDEPQEPGGVVEEVASQDTASAGRLEDEAEPVVRGPWSFTEIGASQLCADDPCVYGWINSQGRPTDTHIATCTHGGYDGPDDTSTVCLFDLRHVSGRRGHVVRYLPASGGWEDLGDFASHGIITTGPTETVIRWAGFEDLDGDGQQELIVVAPSGPVMQKSDQAWVQNESLLQAREALELWSLDFPGIVDLDRDGDLDLLLIARFVTPQLHQQHDDGSWSIHGLAEREPDLRSKAYDWVFHRDASGLMTMFSLGSRVGSPATGIFQQTSADALNFTELPFSYVPEPMGGNLLDLDSSDTPSLLVSGSNRSMCPTVFQMHDDAWFDMSLNVRQPLTNGLCASPADPALYYIPWHLSQVDQHLTLVATGDDARPWNGECEDNPECTDGAVQPLVGLFANRTSGMLDALTEQEIAFVDADGVSTRLGNRRWSRCWDIDQDGDADCAFSGAYTGRPEFYRNEATGPRTCFRLRGNGVDTPANGGLARVRLETADEVWHVWPNSSLAQGDEVCASVPEGQLDIAITWPTGQTTTHQWLDGDAPYWHAHQP